MHPTLQAIDNELTQIAAQVSALGIGAALNIQNNNFGFPGIDKSELAAVASSISATLHDRADDTLGEGNATLLGDYQRRLQLLRNNTVPQIPGQANIAVPTYLTTLDALRRALEPALPGDPQKDLSRRVKRVVGQVRALEARLAEVEPRASNLEKMVDQILRANEAADQLPEDLASLGEARKKIDDLLKNSEREAARISAVHSGVESVDKSLRKSQDEAKAIMAKCESAYTAATSQGLAAAFARRSKGLERSIIAWVVGLVVALVLGGLFGASRVLDLAAALKAPSTEPAAVQLNFLFVLFSVGGPIWFAWLATKQIGQRFRLAEDYAYKAAVSSAYEGYRQEAVRVDKELEVRLLASALDRLGEQPLRFVESASHGSPWHELLSSDVVKNAAKTVPDFGSRVVELASSLLGKANSHASTAKLPNE